MADTDIDFDLLVKAGGPVRQFQSWRTSFSARATALSVLRGDGKASAGH
jgi:hypothetical protein